LFSIDILLFRNFDIIKTTIIISRLQINFLNTPPYYKTPTSTRVDSVDKEIEIEHYNNMFTQYKIQYDFDPETRSVTAVVPALNYLSSFGDNFQKAEQNIKEAIQAYLEALIKEHLEIPQEKILEGTFLKVNVALQPA
jgi:predicted RNase H-like HicB family nuclease